MLTFKIFGILLCIALLIYIFYVIVCKSINDFRQKYLVESFDNDSNNSINNDIIAPQKNIVGKNVILIGDFIYGIDSYGHFRCLDIDTGDRVFEDVTIAPIERWSTAHFVKNREYVWIFNEKGELLLTKLTPEKVNLISRKISFYILSN